MHLPLSKRRWKWYWATCLQCRGSPTSVFASFFGLVFCSYLYSLFGLKLRSPWCSVHRESCAIASARVGSVPAFMAHLPRTVLGDSGGLVRLPVHMSNADGIVNRRSSADVELVCQPVFFRYGGAMQRHLCRWLVLCLSGHAMDR